MFEVPISNWIEAGGTAEALSALVEALPEWTPPESDDGVPDAGAGIDYDAEIQRLAKLSLLKYERERGTAARRLALRTLTLDRLVEAKREELGRDDGKQGHRLSLPEPTPWPECVEGVELLCEMSAAIRKHVVMPDHCADLSLIHISEPTRPY